MHQVVHHVTSAFYACWFLLVCRFLTLQALGF